MKKTFTILLTLTMLLTFFSVGLTANAFTSSSGDYTFDLPDGSTSATLTINSNGWGAGSLDAVLNDIAVNYNTANGTAYAAADVAPFITKLVIADGVTTVSGSFVDLTSVSVVEFKGATPPSVSGATPPPTGFTVRIPTNSDAYLTFVATNFPGHTVDCVNPTTAPTTTTTEAPTTTAATGGTYTAVLNFSDYSGNFTGGVHGQVTNGSPSNFAKLTVKGIVGPTELLKEGTHFNKGGVVGDPNSTDILLLDGFLQTLRKGSYVLTAYYTVGNATYTAELSLNVTAYTYKVINTGTIHVVAPEKSAGFGKYTGKETAMSVELDAPYDELTGLTDSTGYKLVKGAEDDYTVSNGGGSTIITLTEKYLKNHVKNGSTKLTFTATYQNNNKVAGIPINGASAGSSGSGSGNNNSTPKAGDDFSLSIWLLVCAAALIGMAFSGRKALRKVSAK